MSERDLPEEMPVFPLPDSVLFPGTTLPLLVFEPRYRQMVEDVLRFGRWIAVSLLKPGDEAESEGSPNFHEIAGAGFLIRSNRLPDGRFQIALDGRARVRLSEVPSERLYRMVRAVPEPEDPTWLLGDECAETLREIQTLAGSLRLMKAEEAKRAIPGGAVRRAALVNHLALAVMAEPRERQEMLAADFARRSTLVLGKLRFSKELFRSLARYPRPDDPEHN
jgi:ATP-dependent Lon protease